MVSIITKVDEEERHFFDEYEQGFKNRMNTNKVMVPILDMNVYRINFLGDEYLITKIKTDVFSVFPLALLFLLIYMASQVHVFMYMAMIGGFISFFQSKWFYRLMMVGSFRKKGYKKKLLFVSDNDEFFTNLVFLDLIKRDR